MRGKLVDGVNANHGDRITPADAGKTYLFFLKLSEHEDHPRGCGENCYRLQIRGRQLGSPPRMRGKPRFGRGWLSLNRITPADAGKTLAVRKSICLQTDHPRGCGENNKTIKRINNEIGSPPRMRGKHTATSSIYCSFRITPADAGKTSLIPTQNIPNKDHPRGCGENGIDCGNDSTCMGSPPRMRGKRTANAESNISSRITPADAGKTYFCHFTVYRQQDHPRGCGENFGGVEIARLTRGSPPRMRGKRIRC